MNERYLVLVGVNNQTAPLSIREKLAISLEKLPECLAQLRRNASHSVILSTCNRTEVYIADDNPGEAEEKAMRFFREIAQISDDALRPHVYVMSKGKLVEHLFRVACGLDSMVVGEYEVLGQVSHSLEVAEKAGMMNLPLRHIFQSAVRVGRKAREETGISKYALSLSSIAINKAMDIVPDITRSKLIVIGAGEAGKLAARVAANRGASDIVIMSRKEESATRLTEKLGGRPASAAQLGEELKNADIVIACAASPHAILCAAQVRAALRERPGRPMIIIDIAMPRNVDPDVRSVKGVHLYDMDDLSSESDNNRSQRETEIAAVEEMIQKEVELVAKWWQVYTVRPAIKALVSKAEKIRASQYARTLKKISSLTEEDRQAIELLTTSIVDKILHDPISYLKSVENGHSIERTQMIRRLFKLDDLKE